MHHAFRTLLFGLTLTACAAAPPTVTSGAPQASSARATAAAPSSSIPPPSPPPTVADDLTDKEACALAPRAAVDALPNVVPFTRPDSRCSDADPFCDTADQPPDPSDTCFVANANIAQAERESPAGTAGAARGDKPWDGVGAPRYLDRIDAHLHLTPGEKQRLRANGFVVLDRLAYASYANAFHDIFQEQLPLYVGIDPILYAVFRGTEAVLERVERARLQPALRTMLKKLRTTLAQSVGRYDAETRADLDLYLGVAWGLSGSGTQGKLSVMGRESEVAELADAARGASGLSEVELFGRSRMIDFSQLEPRGHYAAMALGEASLGDYFRAVMWLSRLEFNLVSRSCRSSQPGASPDPRETPREARDAMALADLIGRSGASPEVRAFEEVYSSFAGRREDVSTVELERLMRLGGIGPNDREGFDKLKAAIGDGYRRTARVHYMPEGARELPVITTLLGPRIVPDVGPLTRLVHDAVPNRFSLGAADVAYLLGHDRAMSWLARDLRAYPTLGPALEGARAEFREQALRSNDVYGSWARSVLALGQPVQGTQPSFMRRDAYADARINSALVGYGQIRHAFVLLAAQGYDAYGCEIPDAYVEPLPAVYDALLAHVRGMKARAGGWKGLERVLAMLHSIVQTETRGVPLSEPQRRWLAMVAENVPVGGFSDSGQPPKWTGWYFDMFEDREHGASKSTAFVADYFTLTNRGVVKYLGADGPRLAVFVVDVGGEPRAMVGPVAQGFEAETPLDKRLDDAQAVAYTEKTAPWRSELAVPAPAEPKLGIAGRVIRCEGDGHSGEWRVVVRSDRSIGPIRITLLDHHADPLTQPLPITTEPGWNAYVFKLPASFANAPYGVEAIHVRVEDLAQGEAGQGSYDYFTSPSAYQGSGSEPVELPVRPRGTSFALGAKMPAASPGSPIPGFY